jgi:hypothetical protein
MIVLLALLGCIGEIPPHLQVDRPVTVATPQPPPTGLKDLVRQDPLVRRPKPRDPGDWLKIRDGAAVEAWSSVARMNQVTPADWTQLEQTHTGTAAVALARGARLAALEVLLAGDVEAPAQQQVAAWLGATRVETHPTTKNPRGPLAWIPGTTITEKRQAILTIAERSVLLGWLDGPGIELKPAAEALTAPAHTRLLDSPAGALIVSRAALERAEDPARIGRAALADATELALATVAADRDKEQEALRLRHAKLAKALGGKAGPLKTLLHRARISLMADAGADASAGLALVALTGERLFGHCPDGHCASLDRTQALTSAARWGPEVAPFAHAWQVVAVKQAVDTLASSYKKPSFGYTLIDVVDPLSGTGGGPVELALLRYRSADPTALLQISRLARGPGTTLPEEVIAATRAHLARVCDAALASRPPRAIGAEIKRIRDRARRK